MVTPLKYNLHTKYKVTLGMNSALRDLNNFMRYDIQF